MSGIMKRTFLGFYLSLSLLVSLTVSSQEVGIGEWRDHLPYDYATRVAEFGQNIYCSTPYSMFWYDREFSSVHRLSKVNGLSDLGVSDISLNPDEKILVVAYSNTNVDLILENDDIINVPDIKRKEILGNKTINSVMNYGSFAYLSCGFGIVVLNLEKLEVKDTYYIGPNGSSINVLAMTYNDTAFFAATEKGVYTAEIDNPNLAFFGNWTKMSDIPAPNGFISLIHYWDNKLFINVTDEDNPEDDLWVLVNDNWQHLEEGNTERTYSIRSTGDRLVVSYSYFVTSYFPDLTPDLKIFSFGETSPAPSDAIIGTEGDYWIADRNKGLVRSWGEGFQREFIKPSGAPTADIFDMTVSEGDLYVVPGGLTATWGNTWRSARMFSFIEENWKTFDGYNSPGLDTLRDLVAVVADPLKPGHIYAGSWNRGIAEFDQEAVVTIHNADNSELMPNMIDGYPTVKVGGGAFDAENNLWVTNSGAENILAMRRFDNPSVWQSYNLGSGTSGADVRRIVIDDFGQKWIVPRTTQSNPNYLIVFNENNPAGSQVRGLRSGPGLGNIPGTNVFAIARDLEGEIWIGTDQGVAVFYSPEEVLNGGQAADAQQILVNIDGYVQNLLETETVKAIAIDGDNRKWFGTERAGVFLLSEDGTKQIEHFTEENSPLFSNNITSLAYNGKTGEIFIGTAKGLISYKSTATEGGETNTEVYAYPNPVRPGYNGPIAIKGLVRDAIVKITDIYGNVVYETRAEGGQAIWNGANFDGRRANTGVYMVFISTDDGQDEMVTKILFVN